MKKIKWKLFLVQLAYLWLCGQCRIWQQRTCKVLDHLLQETSLRPKWSGHALQPWVVCFGDSTCTLQAIQKENIHNLSQNFILRISTYWIRIRNHFAIQSMHSNECVVVIVKIYETIRCRLSSNLVLHDFDWKHIHFAHLL